jgi:hypothetical protein
MSYGVSFLNVYYKFGREADFWISFRVISSPFFEIEVGTISGEGVDDEANGGPGAGGD